MLYVNKLIAYPKFLLAVLGVLLLSGCTSNQHVTTNDSIQSFLGSIELQIPQNRIEQLFNQRFSTQILGSGTEKAYRLEYTISGTSSSTLSVRGSSSTLVNSSSTLAYQLYDMATGEEVLSGSTTAQATSGTISSYYGQEKSKRFTSERLSGLLAEKLLNKLGLFYIAQLEK